MAAVFCEPETIAWWSQRCQSCTHPLLAHDTSMRWVADGELVPETAPLPDGAQLVEVSVCPTCTNVLAIAELRGRVEALEASAASPST